MLSVCLNSYDELAFDVEVFMEEKTEDLLFIKCDKVVNEIVSRVDAFLPAVINVLKKRKGLDNDEIDLLRLVSHAFVCERIRARIEERRFMGTDEKIDLGCMCSNKDGSCLDCVQEVCNLVNIDPSKDLVR